MFVVCERWVETGTDCYIDPSSPLDHSSISFSSWLGCSTVGPEGPALSLQTGSHAGIPVSDWPTAAGTLSIFFLNIHPLLLFFGLFTQVHLLIDGSVEGQYITFTQNVSLLFNQTCLNERLLPIYPHTRTHTHAHTHHIYIYIFTYIYIKLPIRLVL